MRDHPCLRDRLYLLVGSLGPLGHLPASGTVTVAIVGIPLFWLVSRVGTPVYFLVTLAVIIAAFHIHDVGDRILGEKDSRKLVWDEIAGFLVAVAMIPFTWQLALLALFIERTLDIVKVPPADRIERNWPGGWGVVGDDVVAGLYTCGALHLAVYTLPGWLGLPG